MSYEIHDSAHDIYGRLVSAIEEGDAEALGVIRDYAKSVRDRKKDDAREYWWNVYSAARNAWEALVHRAAGRVEEAVRSEELAGMFAGDVRKLRVGLTTFDLNELH